MWSLGNDTLLNFWLAHLMSQLEGIDLFSNSRGRDERLKEKEKK
jgi:hypothetical protein